MPGSLQVLTGWPWLRLGCVGPGPSGIWVTWGRADSLFVPVMGWREAGGGGDIPGEI